MRWWLSLLLWGLVVLPGHTRPLVLQWTMNASQPWTHTGFIVQSCSVLTTGQCEMKDEGAVAAWLRQMPVLVPENPTQRQCFQVQTVRGTARSAASDRLCVPTQKE